MMTMPPAASAGGFFCEDDIASEPPTRGQNVRLDAVIERVSMTKYDVNSVILGRTSADIPRRIPPLLAAVA
jgi:hypothetical protein